MFLRNILPALARRCDCTRKGVWKVTDNNNGREMETTTVAVQPMDEHEFKFWRSVDGFLSPEHGPGSASERFVLLFLAASYWDRRRFPGLRELARLARLPIEGVDGIRAVLARLEAGGWLKLRRRNGRRTWEVASIRQGCAATDRAWATCLVVLPAGQERPVVLPLEVRADDREGRREMEALVRALGTTQEAAV
jgi:hypothetical protein